MSEAIWLQIEPTIVIPIANVASVHCIGNVTTVFLKDGGNVLCFGEYPREVSLKDMKAVPA